MLLNSCWAEYLLLDQQKQPFNFLLEVKGCFYLNWYAGVHENTLQYYLKIVLA